MALSNEELSAVCRISKLEAEIESLQTCNNSLSEHILELETKNTQLENQLKKLQNQNSCMESAASERKIYTSMMETNNRINLRKIEELKAEIAALRKSFREKERELEELYRFRAQRLKSEADQTIERRDRLYQIAWDHLVAQNEVVVSSLEKEIKAKNELVSVALKISTETYHTNTAMMIETAKSRRLAIKPDENLHPVEGDVDHQNGANGVRRS